MIHSGYETKSAATRRTTDWDRQTAQTYLEARKVLQCKTDTKILLCMFFTHNFHEWWNKQDLEPARNRHALKWRARFRAGIITATSQQSWLGGYKTWCPPQLFGWGGRIPSVPPCGGAHASECVNCWCEYHRIMLKYCQENNDPALNRVLMIWWNFGFHMHIRK